MEPFYNDLTTEGLVALGWKPCKHDVYPYAFRYKRAGAPDLLLYSDGATTLLRTVNSVTPLPVQACLGHIEAYLYSCPVM